MVVKPEAGLGGLSAVSAPAARIQQLVPDSCFGKPFRFCFPSRMCGPD